MLNHETKEVSKFSNPSKKEVRNTIEFKRKIILKYVSGIKIVEISLMYSRLPSTISFIEAKREAINVDNATKAELGSI